MLELPVMHRNLQERDESLTKSLRMLDARIDQAVARISELRRDQRFLASRPAAQKARAVREAKGQ